MGFWRQVHYIRIQPGHVYTAPGTYTILLTAERTNPGGGYVPIPSAEVLRSCLSPTQRSRTNISGLNCTPYTINASAPGWTNETINWYVYDTTLPVYPVIISGPSMTYTFNNEGTFEVHMVIKCGGLPRQLQACFQVYKKPGSRLPPLNLVSCNLDTTISYVNASYANAYTPLTYQWVCGWHAARLHRAISPITSRRPAPIARTYTTSLIASNSVGCRDTAQVRFRSTRSLKSIIQHPTNPEWLYPVCSRITNIQRIRITTLGI